MVDQLLTTENYTKDNLIAGDFPLKTAEGILITGQNLPRGALLGIIGASGKYTLSDSAASDGSGLPAAVLAEDKDAGTEDKTVTVYIMGEFNQNAITFGGAHTAASVKLGLHYRGIILRDAVPN